MTDHTTTATTDETTGTLVHTIATLVDTIATLNQTIATLNETISIQNRSPTETRSDEPAGQTRAGAAADTATATPARATPLPKTVTATPTRSATDTGTATRKPSPDVPKTVEATPTRSATDTDTGTATRKPSPDVPKTVDATPTHSDTDTDTDTKTDTDTNTEKIAGQRRSVAQVETVIAVPRRSVAEPDTVIPIQSRSVAEPDTDAAEKIAGQNGSGGTVGDYVAILGDTVATLHETIAGGGDTVALLADVAARDRTVTPVPLEARSPTDEPRSVEFLLSEVLAEVMEVDEVAADLDYFDDLGADSMTMAHFCARLNNRSDLPSVSIKEVYHHRTIESLATALAAADSEVNESGVEQSPMLPPTTPATPVPTWQYILCGAAQLVTSVGLAFLGAFVLARGYEWVSAATGVLGTYARALVFGSGVFVVWAVLPIIAKWVLIGRSKPTQFRVWGLGYIRFWFVKSLVRSNPLVAFAGTPLFSMYLRALGAKVGRRVLILSGQVPVHADLLTIGDDTVIRKDSSLSCYRAHAGWIQTGPVTVGRNALVGESTVLDIHTSLGDGAQLGHASALHAGQSVPAGEHRQGTPAVQRTDVDYRAVAPTNRSTVRRAVYTSLQVLILFVVTLPVALAAITALAEWRLTPTSFSGSTSFSGWLFYRDVVIISVILFFGLLLIRFALACTVPRLLGRALNPGEVYPLYGIRYWAHRAVGRLTNVNFFTNLFGDSSYIVNYLHLLGYNVTFAEQTGANFGLNVKHENPYWVTVGPGTMAADGLSIINADYSSTSFRISPVVIGSHSFIGNQVAFPSQSKTGEDCLLASKVLVPVEGDIQEHVGFLGSPNFEIPRMVERDREFDDVKYGADFDERLYAKNRHNLVSIAAFLMSRFVITLVGVSVALGAVDLYERFGAVAIVAASLILTVFGTLFNVLVERASTGFQPLRPLYCSLYDPDNWRVERYWKLSWQPAIFNGTPFKNLYWRLMGVHLGKRVFDDGCLMIEKTMISVGDDCVLNAASVIQPHSQEDGTLKTDYVSVGNGCTLGIASLVHYGVKMRDGAILDASAFLMKGTEVPRDSHWGENPAREIRSDAAGDEGARVLTASRRRKQNRDQERQHERVS